MKNKILNYLKNHGWVTLNDIAENIKESKPRVHGYLHFLIVERIVSKKLDNNFYYYKLNKEFRG